MTISQRWLKMARKTIKNPNPTNYDMSTASYRDKNLQDIDLMKYGYQL